MISSTSSSATVSPGLAVIFHTLPTSSALTSVTRFEAQLRSGFRNRCDLMPEVMAESRRLLDQLAVALCHPVPLDVEVVLQADAYVAAHRDRRRHQRPLVETDADDLPMGARRQPVDLVDEVASGARNATEHAHDEAELERWLEHAHVDQRARVAYMARVKALHLRPNA